MTRQEALERMGGRKNAIIGGVGGCLVFVLGGCGLLLGGAGWLGSEALDAVQAAPAVVAEAGPILQVGKDGQIVAMTGVEFNPYDSPDEALHQCAVGEVVIAVWRGGRIEGWACNKDMTIDKGG